MEIKEFIEQLSSNAPTPGGGGAGALAGALGTALCSMVANLTTGKKKYAEYQADIDAILIKTEALTGRLLALIEKDAEAFAPLAKAYGIPKDDPARAEVLEAALVTACAVPLEIMEEIENIADVLGFLAEKGSKLAVSDVGVAATALRAAMEGAALNVSINTKLMKNREYAKRADEKAAAIMGRVVPMCEAIYRQVREGMVIE